LGASGIVVFDIRAVDAGHPRILAKQGQPVQLDHYLEVPKTKTGRPIRGRLHRAGQGTGVRYGS